MTHVVCITLHNLTIHAARWPSTRRREEAKEGGCSGLSQQGTVPAHPQQDKMARGPQVSQLTLWCVHHCITPPCRQTAAKEEDEGGGEERERERLPIRQHRSVGGTTDQSTRLGGLILLIFVSRLTTKLSTRRRRRTKEEARSRSRHLQTQQQQSGEEWR